MLSDMDENELLATPEGVLFTPMMWCVEPVSRVGRRAPSDPCA